MFTSLSRIIKAGWQSFWRNKWLSSSAVLVVSLTIFGITALILVNVLISFLTEDLENKIDISVYFKISTEESKILDIREEIEKLGETQSVNYVSRKEALANFKEEHKDDEVLMQSLEELGGNPFEASLNIKAEQTSQYQQIADFLSQDKYQEYIDKVDYLENKEVIDKLTSVTTTIRQVGFVILLILAFLAVLVTFNTIRLTIYSTREEIKVKKLVGASNWFIRAPFIVEGALYGITSAILVLLIMYPLLAYVSPKITAYLSGSDIFAFFKSNLLAIFMFQLLVGMILGAVSSFIAIRRYLED